ASDVPRAPASFSFNGDKFAAGNSDGPLDVERWVHLAGVMDGRELRLYVDGKVQQQRLAAPALAAFGEKLQLVVGADAVRPKNRGSYFRGRLDELRISKTARYSDNFTPAA